MRGWVVPWRAGSGLLSNECGLQERARYIVSQQRTPPLQVLLSPLDLGWHLDCWPIGMPKLERVRDFVTTPPAADYFGEKLAEGWRLVAIEWERGTSKPGPPVEDIPFGLRVASDCRRLEENPEEVQVLLLMLEVLVQDGPLSLAAQKINDSGFRNRDGELWTRTALFYLLPRLIEVGPRLCTSEEWVQRRKHLFNVA